ncbi:DeoR/GlpR transcriptional regulator [Corynebacterium kroppenstedtii]|nr:DeoR/GlpR transcriptional regulator [Corynebacterium kroppenstedtii]
MYAEERRRQIASLTAVEGRVSVTDLSERFSVTAETVRRDLAQLDREGAIHRVHGGAVASTNFQALELPIDSRARAASGAKAAIGRTAMDYLPPQGAGIFLDAGTTTAVLANHIADLSSGRGWPIVTNCLPIAMNLASRNLTDLQLLGGQIRAITQAVVGDTALRTLALMRADVAFIGTNALTIDHGLSTADPQEAAVKRAMITNANRVIAMCDSSKFGRDYLVSFAALSDIDVLITDSAAPESFLSQLREHEIDVVVAQ